MKKTVALAVLLLARTATAQLTCNGALELSYPSIGPGVKVGDVVTMRASYGAGNILGGSALFVNNFALELACSSDAPVIQADHPPGSLCIPDPTTPVQYLGDATISTNCNTCFNIAGGLPGVPTPCTWSSNNPLG